MILMWVVMMVVRLLLQIFEFSRSHSEEEQSSHQDGDNGYDRSAPSGSSRVTSNVKYQGTAVVE